MAIQLSTGKVKIELVFDGAEKECIYFNPNDPDLYVRMARFQENVENYLKNVEDSLMFIIGAVFVVSCGVIIPIILNDKLLKKYYITRLLFGLK